MANDSFNGFKPPNSLKRGIVGIFQPKWQSHKIAVTDIWSTPNFDRAARSDKIPIQDGGWPLYWKCGKCYEWWMLCQKVYSVGWCRL